MKVQTVHQIVDEAGAVVFQTEKRSELKKFNRSVDIVDNLMGQIKSVLPEGLEIAEAQLKAICQNLTNQADRTIKILRGQRLRAPRRSKEEIAAARAKQAAEMATKGRRSRKTQSQAVA